MFHAGDEVLITSCEDDPRAAGRTGRIVDEVPPGPLTAGRWTVHRIGPLVGPVLCRTDELRKTG
ncbi:hypothetical protein [Streptomyces iconiensis]|uniref:DUF1918 domain-containing protein n=1 Tax=Streptomyces iconiensis TaxID=1384038 RepID=A0ABT7AB49_9ACTN|nr:hypothetical protein [Streptomyces iconiensis]MDJ1138575.1 hypothetical protein [Streptomyces iconiensis]